MKRVLTPVSLAIVAVAAHAQLDANPSKITVEVGPGSTVTKTVRPDNKTRNVHITHNPQDTATIIDPPHMVHGLKVDTTTLIAPGPGSAEERIKETNEAPVPGGGAFRTTCTFAAFGNFDPIVYPGQPEKSHAHFFVGNTGINAFSDVTQLTSTGNSTCRGGIANRSSYWIPTMMDIRNAKPILPDSWLVYYKAANWSPSKGYGWTGADGVWHPSPTPWPGYSVPPIGMKLVAGDPNRTTPPTSRDPFSYRWNCRINGVNNFASQIPATCPTGATLGLEIFMPQCHDGKNIDSPDHRSHMAYPITQRNIGDPRGWSHSVCPSTHPHVLPQISFSISWTIRDIPIAAYRLASDVDVSKPAGLTAHGDWFNGWKFKWLEMAMKNCVIAEKDCHAHLLGLDPEDGKLKQIY